MKKTIILLFIIILSGGPSYLAAQDNFVDSLSTINPELRKYFPRWKVCEPDLQFQIYQAFNMLGFRKDQLDMQDIEVLASPKDPSEKNYDILLVSCGDASINSRQIDSEIKQIGDYLSGKDRYRILGKRSAEVREYCFTPIPIEVPVKPDQGAAIIEYMEPSNAQQAITMSLFSQSLKVGETGFWLQSHIGNDAAGLPHWTAGEASFVLKRPLYVNNDPSTNKQTPYLINAYLGFAYKINSGLDNDGSMFSWLPERQLNSVQQGKLVAGLDVHMPFHPNFGLHFNISTPFSGIENGKISDPSKWGIMNFAQRGLNEPTNYYLLLDAQGSLRDEVISDEGVENGNLGYAPILTTTGQVTLFYNLWLNSRKLENFFRFDVGLNYTGIEEYFMLPVLNPNGNFTEYILTNDGITEDGQYALTDYNPSSLADWIYAKVEYRNQAVYPFSASLQLSNQTLLTRAYVPLFGNFLFLEAKYATPLRDRYPFEPENGYFVISPVLRITM